MVARKKPPPDSRVTPPPGRALRVGDLTPQGSAKLDQRMSRLGNAKTGQRTIMRRLAKQAVDPNASEETRDQSARRLVTHKAMKAAGAFVDRDITMENAVESQTGYINRGRERGHRDFESGLPGMHTDRRPTDRPVMGLSDLGADWYFEHHGKLAGVSKETGIDKERVITGSTVMSPQNNPVQELAAVHALARAHADPAARVTVTPGAVAESEDKSIADWTGRSVHPSEMQSHQFAALKAPKVRGHVQTEGDVNLAPMAKGGTTENVTKSIDVLRGNTAPEDAIDPHGSPKVHSYREAIRSSDPSATHVHEEFLGRMDNVLRQLPGQQRMDTFGLKDSTEGILSPTHPIANDTWMQAAQSGQRPEVVDTGRSGKARWQSPAKFGVGEAGSANEKKLTSGGIVKGGSPAMIRHAWGQESVERTGAELGRRNDEHVPSVGVQGVVWTEIRRQAGGGKDAEYEGRVAAHQASQQPAARPGRGQRGMFSAGEGGTETVNPSAVLSQSRQLAMRKTAARGVQGELFG
jgi:hypothetical protein